MAADGTTFPPFQTIPELKPVASLKFTAQVWISQDGQDWRANIGDIAALMPPHVTSFNGRTGDINLGIADITQAGGAPNSSPVLVGVPQAPTPPRGADDTRIATAAFVQDALSSSVVGVASFNGRAGDIVLETADITGAGGATAAQLVNYLPLTGGFLSGPGNLTVNGALNAAGGLTGSSAVLSGDLSIGAAKGANLVWAGPATGVPAAPTWRRLSAADITGIPQGTVTSVGVTAPADMLVSGSPVTGAGTINVTRVSQAANLVLASPNGAPGIPSYRGLVPADIAGGIGVTSVGLTAPAMFTVSGSPVTGAGNLGLALAPQPNNFVLAGPTAGGPLAPTFRQLTAADISGLATGTVSSVGLALPASVFGVVGSPVTGAGTLTGVFNSQAANTVLAAPSGAGGQPSFRALTQADISNGVGVTSVGLAMPSPFTVVGTNPVTGSGTLTVGTSSQPQNTVWAAPVSGGAGAPNFRLLTQADISGGVGVTSLGLTMPADFTVANSPVTGAGTLIVSRSSQAAGLFLASPAGAAGVPSYRAIAPSDLPAGVGTVTSVGLALPSIFTVSGSPVTGNGTLTGALAPQNANLVWAGPSSGGAAAPTFRALTAADIPSLSGSYLPLTGGTVTGPVTHTAGVTITGVGPTALSIDGAAGSTRPINFQSGGVQRWRISANAAAEGGSNAGSDLIITPYNDAGSITGVTALTLTRATGAATFGGALTAAGPVTANTQLNVGNLGGGPIANPTKIQMDGSYSSTEGATLKLDLYSAQPNAFGVGIAGGSLFLASGGTIDTYNGATQTSRLDVNGNKTLAGQLNVGNGTGHLIGGAGGSLSTPVQATTNLMLYNVGSTNWAGIMADTAGSIGFVAGNAAPSTKFVIGQDGGLYGPASVAGGDMGAGTLNIPGPIYLGGSQIGTNNLRDRDSALVAFTPTLSVTTLGDGVWSGVSASGFTRRLGFLVYFEVQIAFTLTFTTASGNLLVAGLPYTANQPLGLYPLAMNPPGAAPAGLGNLLGAISGGNIVFYITGNNYIGNYFGPGLYGLVSGTAYVMRTTGIYLTNAP